MERLIQGPINPYFYGKHLDADSTIGFVNNMNSESLKFEEEGEEPNYYGSSTGSLDDNVPFLQMLQSAVEAPPLLPFTYPNFQTLPRLEQLKKKKKPWDLNGPEMGEKRKRKRQRQSKKREAVESQRLTHIAVERNRRRQMNDYLNSLRSLMPTSYVQGGHQASIIGGAIDFVKELEQLLNSLEVQKRMRLAEKGGGGGGENWKMEVRVIKDHVNVKVHCRRRSGQVVKAIVGLEQQLRLTVLHLNITSSPSQDTVLYSFNLKIEDGCEVVSVEEIAAAVQQIFNIINGS